MVGGPTVQDSHLAGDCTCSCRDGGIAGGDWRVLCMSQGLCMLKERRRHLVDGGRAKGDDTIHNRREVGGG